MFFSVVGVPAGYGYFTIDSVENENIMPAVKEYVISNDPNRLISPPFSIGTISLQVDTDCQVSINGRAPVLVKADQGLTFDARGVNSIVFKASGVKYNLGIIY